MKKFFGEFKKFITRGNVVDLAVGVIIGSAFTAIVTALTKNILQPLINAVISVVFGNGEMAVYTFLVGSAESLETAIYIDWGAFISAIIDFLLIALVLFIVVRTINHIKERNEKVMAKIKKGKLSKEDRTAIKKAGIKFYDKEAVKAYLKDKADKEEAAKKAAEEQAKLDAEEAKKHTTEGLLESIKELLEKQAK
jgi:large conductance mechanosensitive channel